MSFKRLKEWQEQEDKAKSLFEYYNNELQLGHYTARLKAIQFCQDMIEEGNNSINWQAIQNILIWTSYGE